jgi:hypothetical protein
MRVSFTCRKVRRNLICLWIHQEEQFHSDVTRHKTLQGCTLSSPLGEMNDVCERPRDTGRWEFTAWRSAQRDKDTRGNKAPFVWEESDVNGCGSNIEVSHHPGHSPYYMINSAPLVSPVNNSGSGLVTRIRSGVRIPVRAMKFLFKMPRPVLGVTQTHSIDTGALSRGENWPGREVDHSHPSSAKVKNECRSP